MPSRQQLRDAYSPVKRSIRPIQSALAISSFIPFLFTFVIVSIFAFQKLFPLLSGQSTTSDLYKYNLRPRRASIPRLRLPGRSWIVWLWTNAAPLTFSITISLSAVLAELIFCEISDLLDSRARSIALEVTISILLVSLVIVTPALEIHSITASAGWRTRSAGKFSIVMAWMFDVVGIVGWLAIFWWIGRAVLGNYPQDGRDLYEENGFSEGSLKRIGIIGISLMGSLAGFAAVSSIWHTFGVRYRRVTDSDISRKQGGLEATRDLIAIKQSRLRALEAKMPESSQESFLNRFTSTIRGGNPEVLEMQTLRLEISGLETMEITLSNSLHLLRSRKDTQERSGTAFGRACTTTSYLFALYCLYRITATSIATLRRWKNPSATFANSDPINNALALIAKHWDPTLDRAAWSRQISFVLSGLMLLASFNAVWQTVMLFSRFTPTRLQHSAQKNLALVVSQICATYVVSSALLLRSNLPKEMGSVIGGALRAPLDTAFVERWFEAWFLGACLATMAGIWVGRKVVGSDDWGDDADEEDVEIGKKS